MKLDGRVLLLLLWIEIESIRSCPSECNCFNDENGKYNLDCKNLNTQSVINLPITTQILIITGGNFINLTAETFRNLTNIELLKITETKLKNIEPYTFHQLLLLSSISLDKNQISLLHNNTFNDLPSLKTISLQYNKIVSIERNCFNNLSKLERLYIDVNKLSNFEEGTFVNLTNLEGLFLSNNKLTRINKQMFNGLARLTSLNVFRNLIASIEEDTFQSLSSLREFWPKSNKLTTLPKTIFVDLKNLQLMSLIGNPISEITYSMQAKISSKGLVIDLPWNTLNCSCKTYFSISSMLTDGVRFNSATFKTPDWLDGFVMGDLNESKSISKCTNNRNCLYNLAIGCKNSSCPQNNTIDCECVKFMNGSRLCSEKLDCRTYGCEKSNVCTFDQLQWKCTYVCNNTECFNKGKCISRNKSFVCDCKTGFRGLLCDTTIEYIESNDFDTKTIVLIIVIVLLFIISLVVILLLCIYFRKKMKNQANLSNTGTKGNENRYTNHQYETNHGDDKATYKESVE